MVSCHDCSALWQMCDPLGLSALVVDEECPRGNAASFAYMKGQVLRLLHDERAIVFLLEDDYVMQPTAIAEMVEVRRTGMYRPSHTVCHSCGRAPAATSTWRRRGDTYTVVLTPSDACRCSSRTTPASSSRTTGARGTPSPTTTRTTGRSRECRHWTLHEFWSHVVLY